MLLKTLVKLFNIFICIMGIVIIILMVKIIGTYDMPIASSEEGIVKARIMEQKVYELNYI